MKWCCFVFFLVSQTLTRINSCLFIDHGKTVTIECGKFAKLAGVQLKHLCVPFVMQRRFPLHHPLPRNALSLLVSVGGFLRRWHGCAATNPPSSASQLRSSASSSGRQGRKMRQLMMVDGRHGAAMLLLLLLLLCWISWIT